MHVYKCTIATFFVGFNKNFSCFLKYFLVIDHVVTGFLVIDIFYLTDHMIVLNMKWFSVITNSNKQDV